MQIHALIAAILTCVVGSDAGRIDAIDVGDRVQPIVDRHLVETMDGVDLRLATPRDEGSVFEFDRPWEGRFSGYTTVIHDGGIIRECAACRSGWSC